MKTLKYKAGDIVLIRDDLIEGKFYEGYEYGKRFKMNIFLGKIAKIEKISPDYTYFIYGQDRLNSWTDEMVEREATLEEKRIYEHTLVEKEI